MQRTPTELTLNAVEHALFRRAFRGKLRLAGAYSRLVGLSSRPFEGTAYGAVGNFYVDTTHHEDWAMIFGGMEHAHLKWALAECRSAERAWDIGAHHGYYTVGLAGVVPEVVAFEPFPASAQRIRTNVALNAVDAAVHEVAVADRVGRAELLLSTGGSQNHSIVGHNPSGEVVDVEATTLDALAEELGVPDFVKMDVEGAELRVFRGAARLLGHRKTTFLFESELWQPTRAEVHELLLATGYRVTSLVRDRERDGTAARMLVARPPR